MKRVILLLCIPFICFASNPLTNDREGESSFYHQSKVLKIKENMKQEYISTLRFFEELEGRACSLELYKEVRGFFPEGEASKKLIKNSLFYARYNNAIDDIVLRNLVHINNKFKVVDVKLPKVTKKTKLTERQQAAYHKNSRVFPAGKGPCLADRWNNVYRELLRSYPKRKKLSQLKLKKLNKRAYEAGIISEEVYKSLEEARKLKLHKLDLTLNSYLSKKRSLRDQFKVDPDELSSVATQKSYTDKKKTLRMQLYDKFDFMQMSLMAKLVEKMRERLNAVDVSIVVNYDGDKQDEVITLDPMEQYRFILKMFRKELHELNQMSFFDNRKATYLDVLSAAYETGVVPAEEMIELEKLDDIWNPKKSRAEKIMFWVRNFGSIGAILLPPPYGFVAVLAISVIEGISQIKKKQKEQANEPKDYSLF